MRKSLAAAMAAITFGGAVAATAVPAEARQHGSYRYYDRGRHDNTGAAVAAGVVGLALGAALASSGNRNGSYRGGYYSSGYAYDPYYGGDYGYSDRGYYPQRGYYDRYSYRTCESSRWVWDPYIRERVLIRSRYAC